MNQFFDIVGYRNTIESGREQDCWLWRQLLQACSIEYCIRDTYPAVAVILEGEYRWQHGGTFGEKKVGKEQGAY